jgi:hypothetical protein
MLDRISHISMAVLIVSLGFGSTNTMAQDLEARRLGQQLYRDGLLSDGQPSKAIVQSDVEASGVQFTCIGCHQRSGLGTSEGGQQTPAVTGAILFEPIEFRRRELHEPNIIRPAYDTASLKMAIRSGVSSNGELLDPLMPRYPLTDAELDNLIAYLSSLTADPDPGVTADTVHFATIVAGPVPQDAIIAIQNVVDRYFMDKNALTRQEDRRAENAPWHKDFHYESYRSWELHTWVISGDPLTWADQLQEAYDKQPVFAVIGGVGSSAWEPVDSFCASMQLPCILPSTLLVPNESPDFYTLYFNAGIALEARVLAKYLTTDEQAPRSCGVLQVHDDSPVSRKAARTLTQSLSSSVVELETLAVGDQGEFVDLDWSTALADTNVCDIVLWLSAVDMGDLALFEQYPQVQNIYTSSSLVPDPATSFADTVKQKVRLTYPFQLVPPKRENPRLTGWARGKQIDLTHKRLQANTFYAVNLTADAMQHIRSYFSRDYFIERIEHMVNRMLATPSYDGLSLAPGQRFLSKGAYIVRIPDDPNDEMVPLSEWIVP